MRKSQISSKVLTGFFIYPPLWTSHLVAMYDDIRNRSIRNTIQETVGTRFAKKVSFYKKIKFRRQFYPVCYREVKCYLKAKKEQKYEKSITLLKLKIWLSHFILPYVLY